MSFSLPGLGLPRAPRRYESAVLFAVWILIPFFVALSVGIARSRGVVLHACEHQTDYVLLSLNVENAHRGEALTGAYSRLGFRHPGPVLFYVYSLGDYLFPFLPQRASRYVLMQICVSAGLVLLSLYAFFCYVRPRWLVFVWGAVVLLYFRSRAGSVIPAFGELWNPHPAIPAMLCLLATGAALLCGHRQWLLAFCASCIIAFQTHLGAAPVAGLLAALVGLSCLYALYQRGFRGVFGASLGSVAASTILVCAAFFPVIFEALVQPDGGNLGALLRFSAHAPVRQPAAAVLDQLSRHYDKLLPRFLEPVALGVPFLLLLFSVFRAPVRSRYSRMAIGLGIVGTAGSFYSLLKTQGELFSYLLLYHFGIAAVVVAAGAGLLAARALGTKPWAPFLAAGLWGSALMVSFWPVQRVPESCAVLGEARSFVSALRPEKGVRYHLVMRDEYLKDSLARFALVMRRRGVDFCVDSKFSYFLDASLTCDFRRRFHGPASRNVEVLMGDLEKGELPAWQGGAKVRSVGIAWRDSS